MILESVLKSQKEIGIHCGVTDIGKVILGISFYHEDNGVGKHHFGILSVAY